MLNFLNKDFKIVEKSKIWLIIPAVILVIGIVLLCIFGFNLGIEFAGGTQLSISVSGLTDASFSDASKAVLGALKDLGIDASDAQKENLAGQLFVKTGFKNEINGVAIEGNNADTILTSLQKLYEDKTLTEEDRANLAPYLGEGFDYANYQGITKRIAAISSLSDSVVKIGRESTGPTVSQQLFTNSLLALSIALACILVYIIIRFRSLGGFAAGLAAVVALLHDVLIMMAFMVLFGLFGMQINSTFVAAVVTIVGYSINNTIVIFDRVRENQKNAANTPLEAIANTSVKQVMGRTIFTSLTTLLAVLVLTILGVSNLREFTMPILVGLIAGTYSSVFLAAPLWTIFKLKGGKKGKKPQPKKPNVKTNNKIEV